MSTRAWRVALVTLMLGALAFAVRPLPLHDGPENWFPHVDKLHHLWYFGLLWWIGLRAGFRPGWPLALGLMGYGVGIEFAQSLTPTRAVEALDLLADGAGICAGWLFTQTMAKRLLRRQPEEHGR